MARIGVDKVTEPYLGESEVGENLGDMDRRQGVDRFDFDDDGPFNKKVQTETHVQARSAIADRDGDLAFDGEAGCTKLLVQTVFVDGLQKARPELAVDSESGINDSLADPIDFGADRLVASVPFVHPLVLFVMNP
jgi:hypothetical protein